MTEPGLVIERLDELTEEVLGAFARLIPQLSNVTPPDTEALRAILAQPGASVLVARSEDGAIDGTLTLVIFAIPTGHRALIEDVVVDEGARGKGIATALIVRALELAAAAGCRSVELTSRPSRVAANSLYQRLGFVQRDTNVYRFTLEA